MVTAIDAAIGRIVQTLEDTKMIDNTMIVFTTDNGGNVLAGGNNFPLRGSKVFDFLNKIELHFISEHSLGRRHPRSSLHLWTHAGLSRNCQQGLFLVVGSQLSFKYYPVRP